MKAVDYLKEKVRMCKSYECPECPLSMRKNNYKIDCVNFIKSYPEEAVELVEKWAKENPVTTYLLVLLEKLPNTKLYEGGYPKFCPHIVFNTNEKCPSSNMSCKDCWNREYKEGSMNYKVGDVVRVVGNHNAHDFEIGELVTITEVFEEDGDYRAEGKDDYWYIRDVDCESVVRKD